MMTSVLKTDDLQPGMVLARQVMDRHGRHLLGPGVRLTAKHLRVLKAWGVIEAAVQFEADHGVASSLGQLEDRHVKAAEKEVQGRFAHVQLKNEAMAELFKICVLKKAQELAATGGEDARQGGDDIPEPDADLDPAGDGGAAPAIKPGDLLEKEIELPALPAIFHRINQVINNPRSSSKDIADIVEKDTSLSARLLMIVNSAFYGFPSKIDTLSRAVALLGSRHVSSLAMGISIISYFKGVPNNLLNMESFWKHGVACAVASRALAAQMGADNPERLFMGGLLHDIGRLIICKYLPRQETEAIKCSQSLGKPLFETEFTVLGFRHTNMGRRLLKKWKLPTSLTNMVAHHHAPMNSPEPLEASVVYLANLITLALCFGSSGEQFVPPLYAGAWRLLGLSKNVFSPVAKQMERQVDETVRFFYGD